MFQFNPAKIRRGQELGHGSYGYVHPYAKDSTDRRYAIKVMRARTNKQFFQMIHEVVIGYSCHHPAILPLLGYHVEENHDEDNNPDIKFFVYLKMPRMHRSFTQLLTDTRNRNSQQSNISEADIVKCFHSLACGLQYLHDRRLAHRDIKPSNVLSDGCGNLKISDAGCALLVADEEDTTMLSNNSSFGTYKYLSPEGHSSYKKLRKSDYHKSDMWSLGVMMLEMGVPTQMLEFDHEQRVLIWASVQTCLRHIRGKYSKVLVDLIEALLQQDPTKRKSAGRTRTILEYAYTDILQTKNNARYTIDICRADFNPQEAKNKPISTLATAIFNKFDEEKKAEGVHKSSFFDVNCISELS